MAKRSVIPYGFILYGLITLNTSVPLALAAHAAESIAQSVAKPVAKSTAAPIATLRDPTRPGWSPSLTGAVETKPVVNLLTAIVIGENKRLALIGDRYLRVGDRFGDAKLIRIAFDHVVLQGGGGERVLRLTPLLDSRPAAAKANGS